jgi:hypothetical protein
MLRIYLVALCSIICSSSIAQEDVTCYQKYAKVFEVRGAKPIEDGVHKDVIVTVRKGSFADCFVGQVKVENGEIDPRTIHLSFVDGTFEQFKRSYKYDDPVTILNGISKTLVTKDEELVNVMFVKSIKPKKKALKRAPEPEFDL